MKEPPWFIAAPSQWSDEHIVLGSDESHHATRALRIAPGEDIAVTDGRGRVARCSVTHIEEGRVFAAIRARETRRQPVPQIAAYVAAAKGRKLDDAVERLAELGVDEVHVYFSARSVVRWEAEKLVKLTDRWSAIARTAAKRARSPFLLAVEGGLSWNEVIGRLGREQAPIVLWEKASLSLHAALDERAERLALITGPEGGLASEEAEALARVGGRLVSLGPRIFRAEVAPVVAACVVLSRYGLIG